MMMLGAVVPLGANAAEETQLGTLRVSKVGGIWQDYHNRVMLIPSGSTVEGLYHSKLYAEYDEEKGGYVVTDKVASHRSYTKTVGRNAIGLCFNYNAILKEGRDEAFHNWKTWCKIREGDVLMLSGIDLDAKTVETSGTWGEDFVSNAIITVKTDRKLESDTFYSEKTIVTLGDSLTCNGGWTEDVSDIIGTDIINCGIGGDSTAGALARFDRDVKPHNPDIVILMIGCNDLLAASFSQATVNKYKQDLLKIYDKCTEIGAQVIFMTHNKIKTSSFEGERRYATFGGVVGSTDKMMSTMKEVAEEKDALVIDNWSYWKELREESYLIDTCHPNGEGYDLYVKNVSEFLLKNAAEILGLDNSEVCPLAESAKGVAELKDDGTLVGKFSEMTDEQIKSLFDCDVQLQKEFNGDGRLAVLSSKGSEYKLSAVKLVEGMVSDTAASDITSDVQTEAEQTKSDDKTSGSKSVLPYVLAAVGAAAVVAAIVVIKKKFSK